MTLVIPTMGLFLCPSFEEVVRHIGLASSVCPSAYYAFRCL